MILQKQIALRSGIKIPGTEGVFLFLSDLTWSFEKGMTLQGILK